MASARTSVGGAQVTLAWCPSIEASSDLIQSFGILARFFKKFFSAADVGDQSEAIAP